MSHTHDTVLCHASGNGPGLLAVNPFYALRYHFGMLLGVDDFETEQAYHRGKMQLHNAWLHREGVVWGFDVSTPDVEAEPGTKTGEVRVEPGLAYDPAGRELHLETAACLNLGAWFAEHREDADLEVVESENGVRFDAHVIIRFRACLTRAVPALSEPCEGAQTETAYSRAFETVEILLRPGRAPTPTRPYHRLRLLFALEDPHLDEDDYPLPGDQEVLDARAAILALPAADQPSHYLEAFRRFAALDEIELQPDSHSDGSAGLFASEHAALVVLADLADIRLERSDDHWLLLGADVDTTVRPTHVATSTIQELLCGPLFTFGGAPAPPPPAEEEELEGEEEEEEELEPEAGGELAPVDEGLEADPMAEMVGEDAGGPRIDPATVSVTGETIRFRAVGKLSKASVQPRAFYVSSYDRHDGWHYVEIHRATLDSTGLIRLHLRTAPGGNLVRIVARGTGGAPLLNTDLVPLAGALGGPAGGRHQGHDFVFMLKRR